MTAPAFSEANRRYVASLYRRALKTSLNWYVHRDLWREKALEIRERFVANKNVASTVELRKILENTERELEEFKHPDPYRCEFVREAVEKNFFKSTCGRILDDFSFVVVVVVVSVRSYCSGWFQVGA